MFQRVAKAEEEEKQCTLGPGAERRGTSGSHEHQRVDFEALELQILDRLANGEPPAEAISGDIAGTRSAESRVGPSVSARVPLAGRRIITKTTHPNTTSHDYSISASHHYTTLD